MKTITSIFLIMLFCAITYSQTEQEYFEKQRLERKDKKVKARLTYRNDNTLNSKDHYDENGFLTKREIFYTSKPENIQYLYMEIFINNYDASGNISGNEILYETGKKINEFPFDNMSFTYFYEIGFGENITDEVKYIFDNNNRLIEKRFYYDDVKGYIYDKEILFYNSMGQHNESKHYSAGNTNISISKNYYNIIGLLEKEEYSESNSVETDVIRYEYEFY